MGSVGSTNAKACFSVTANELPLADTWPLPAPEWTSTRWYLATASPWKPLALKNKTNLCLLFIIFKAQSLRQKQWNNYSIWLRGDLTD